MHEKREIQKELFEEFAQPAKLRKNILEPGAARRIYNITLSNEQLIFVFIGLVILLVICFSLGVERGKRIVIAKKELSAISYQLSAESQKPEVEMQKPKAESRKPKAESQRPTKVSSPYAIQVAAYKDNKQAEKEKELLEKKGYLAEITRNGKYSVVYVAGFANKKEAENAAKKLKDRYKDCFIKKRK